MLVYQRVPNNTLASKSGSSSSISQSCSFRVKSPGGTWIKQAAQAAGGDGCLLSDAGSMEKPQKFHGLSIPRGSMVLEYLPTLGLF